MNPVSHTNTHHDVTDLVNQGTVKNTKTWISWHLESGAWPFYETKKFLTYASDDTFWEGIVLQRK